MTISIKQLSAHQVLQRGPDGAVHLRDAVSATLPTGGPYTVATVDDILVGDLWILAGQSNMEGVGDLVDVETPDPRVRSLQSREEWAVAEEPLHWLGESPRFVHHKLWGRETVQIDAVRDPQRKSGAGLGLTFAKTRLAHTGVPVGLIPSAHGGTSMEQWNPALKSEGGASLYGATLARAQACGGAVAGVLWYQGESDCYAEAAALYKERMTALVQAFRADLAQPDLPFLLVQLGCVVAGPDPAGIAGWNSIREAQRTWAATQDNVHMVSAVDLGLDDSIHISTQGLKRLGRRLADAAEGIPAPALRSATLEHDGLRVRVAFDHVRGGLECAGRAMGFSLRTGAGDELVRIYKTTLEGSDAVLHLTEALPPGTHLWYGWGLNPFCNVTDTHDGAVPVFGPVPLS